jgi:hypothetical protein
MKLQELREYSSDEVYDLCCLIFLNFFIVIEGSLKLEF